MHPCSNRPPSPVPTGYVFLHPPSLTRVTDHLPQSTSALHAQSIAGETGCGCVFLHPPVFDTAMSPWFANILLQFDRRLSCTLL